MGVIYISRTGRIVGPALNNPVHMRFTMHFHLRQLHYYYLYYLYLKVPTATDYIETLT